jgi:hypothetical protein
MERFLWARFGVVIGRVADIFTTFRVGKMWKSVARGWLLSVFSGLGGDADKPEVSRG